MSNYPHFVQKYSEISNPIFTSFYMSDEEVEKIHKVFPQGAYDRISSAFYFSWKGKTLDDLPSGKDRDSALTDSSRLKIEFKPQIEEFENLLHKGYVVLFDAISPHAYKILKGKIKYNEHTCYKLLESCPKSVSKIVCGYIWYIIEAINIIETARECCNTSESINPKEIDNG